LSREWGGFRALYSVSRPLAGFQGQLISEEWEVRECGEQGRQSEKNSGEGEGIKGEVGPLHFSDQSYAHEYRTPIPPIFWVKLMFSDFIDAVYFILPA